MNRKLHYNTEFLEDAAKRHGINVSLVRVRLCRGWDLNRALTTPVRPRAKRQRRDLYPNIERWMSANNFTLLDAAIEIDIDAQTLASILYGYTEPRKCTIDKILAATGLTYEECFEEA